MSENTTVASPAEPWMQTTPSFIVSAVASCAFPITVMVEPFIYAASAFPGIPWMVMFLPESPAPIYR